MIHLMHGFIGSGKTTRAREIEERTSALRFTPDEWMVRLFGEDPPAERFQEHLQAVLDLVRPLWLHVARLGGDVILDFGFWDRASRRKIERFLETRGLEYAWVRVTTPLEECRRRNQGRGLAGQATLHITDATFDLLAARFEPMEEG